MKRIFHLSFVCCLLILVCSCANQSEKLERDNDFNADWTFQLGNDSSAISPDFDDSGWRKLNLPHDWAIEGDFSKDNPSGTSGGALPGGIGWYRKTFSVANKELKYYIYFEGVYMNSTVYLNGQKLGSRPYGYISFSYDMTPYLKFNEKNVLVVKVDNEKQPNSRWYSGCGIYRPVHLMAVNPVHIAQWGTYVTAEKVSEQSATLAIRATIENAMKAEKNISTDVSIKVHTIVQNKDGQTVAEVSSDNRNILSGQSQEIVQELNIANPTLWNIDNPYMYNIKTELCAYDDNRIIDTYNTPFGIRTFEFSAEKGFILNGKQIKINGVCLHHDLGSLGAAFNTRAMEAHLEMLKEMGCNGIRCSHNPPAPEMLDLCDRMGFIVMDETFDMWYLKKTKYDYGNYFEEWYEQDMTDLLLRDRNHPSVFMWSIGNEVREQNTRRGEEDNLSETEVNFALNFPKANAGLNKEGEELNVNALLTRKLCDIAKKLDPTRPTIAACNYHGKDNNLFLANSLDILGFNYGEKDYKDVPKEFPGKPFVVTESVSGLATRGYYRMPSDSMFIWPKDWRHPFNDPSLQCSDYDNCNVPWGSTQEDTWREVKKYDFVAGQYIWTGYDYIGEPTPYPWPARSSYFGIIDLAGFPKDIYYMYQSEWRPDKTVLHLFPHWNWTEGQDIDIWCYYNNADEAELFINGKSQGVKTKEPEIFHVWWRVKFEPGTVKVVSRKDGKVVAEQEIHTAGAPAQIRLTPDRTEITADGKDISYITVEVLDKDGNLCPNADNDISFDVQGCGFNAGVDNGCQTSMEHFKANHRKAFYGKCMLTVMSNGKQGTVGITATADGLNKATTTIHAK
ncbi:MAG: glycoside hydrolase family 2 TIM barrel-domain containing protein [Phocaeicola sp.]|uniref:glycoside hydrolase family 2 TIM barrel-domain containing protein n=1 Tax=Phocaeicola sp. TaxID=2773926 RepID=UPI003F9EE3EC